MALGPLAAGTAGKLIRIAVEVGGAILAHAVDSFYEPADRIDTTFRWPIRKFSLVFDRTGVGGVGEDVAVISFHMVNITGGQVDETWTVADYDAVRAELNNLVAGYAGDMGNNTTFAQTRVYTVRPTALSGPPVKVYTENTVGTGIGDPLPPQVAISVTERTALRKHWGRVYLPSPATETLGTDGNILPLKVNNIADIVEQRFNNLRALDYMPVVYSPTTRRAHEVTKIQVDDVFDVIRRRRWDKPSLRAVRPI